MPGLPQRLAVHRLTCRALCHGIPPGAQSDVGEQVERVEQERAVPRTGDVDPPGVLPRQQRQTEHLQAPLQPVARAAWRSFRSAASRAATRSHVGVAHVDVDVAAADQRVAPVDERDDVSLALRPRRDRPEDV